MVLILVILNWIWRFVWLCTGIASIILCIISITADTITLLTNLLTEFLKFVIKINDIDVFFLLSNLTCWLSAWNKKSTVLQPASINYSTLATVWSWMNVESYRVVSGWGMSVYLFDDDETARRTTPYEKLGGLECGAGHQGHVSRAARTWHRVLQ